MRFLSKLKTLCFLRMSYLSDTLTVGVLLVLLFGAISLYLYTRIQQAEQKIHLLESILLDLKMSTEIKSYTELPAEEYSTPENPTDQERNQERNQERSQEKEKEKEQEQDNHYVSLDDAAETITEYTSLDDADDKVNTVITLDEAESEQRDSEHAASTPAAAVLYDNMTLKDLQSLARTRGITGAGSMKKGAIIEALKTSDRTTVIKPGSVGTNSFLETSALVSDVSA
jgi:Rho termination factor, N-terminal domain